MIGRRHDLQDRRLIEFLPFGILAGIPAGAATLPSMTSTVQQKVAAMPIVFLTAGCFLLQAVLFFFLLLARRSAAPAEIAAGSVAS